MAIPVQTIGSLDVPVLCLGTANWGGRLDSTEAWRLADTAWDRGLHFFDTAEGYPAPMRVETHGRAERILGTWAKTKPRDQILLCSKVYGPSRHFRAGAPSRLDPDEIEAALNRTLHRLGTDYLDLYLLHWPDSDDYDDFLGGRAADRRAEQIDRMNSLIRAGKNRAWGLSNASPEDVAAYQVAASIVGAPGPVIVQNPWTPVSRGGGSLSLPLMAYGVLGHGMMSRDGMRRSLHFALSQPSTRCCCVGASRPSQLIQLTEWARG